MELKSHLQDYTRAEFTAFVAAIINVAGTRHTHNRLIQHFDDIVQHPQGADMLFYPEADDELAGADAMEAILYRIKKWHSDHGRLTFKDDLPTPAYVPRSPSTPRQTPAERATKTSSDNLLKIQKIASQISEAIQSAEIAFAKLQALLIAPNAEPPSQVAASAGRADLAMLERKLADLEAAKHELTRSTHRYSLLKFTVQFAQNDAQRSLAYRHLDATLQATIAQQMSNTYAQYQAQQAAFSGREQEIHSRTQALLLRIETHLIKLAAAIDAGPLKDPVTYRSPLSDIDALPKVYTPTSDFSNAFDAAMPGLSAAVRSAISGLAWITGADGADPAARRASILSFQYDKPGCGEPFAISVPLSHLVPVEGRDWLHLALTNAEIELPYRINSDVAEPQGMQLSVGLKEITELAQVYVVGTGGTVASTVKVRPALWDADTGGYRFTLPGLPTCTVSWASPSSMGAAGTSGSAVIHGTRAGLIAPAKVPTLEPIVLGEEPSFNDCIVVFPYASGIDPVYMLFKGAREYAGVASGRGQPLASDWPQTAARNMGAVIPSQVADQLRNQVFRGFNHFREAFWRCVASDAGLAARFPAIDSEAMRKGRGGLEIHYVIPPSAGGDVYDMDNMRLRAPLPANNAHIQQHLSITP